jgi:uncharacterized damage-inducible protein DinB
MTTAKEAIVHSLTNSKIMVRRFTEDLRPEEYVHRPTEKANCAAWLLGHVTLADRSAAQALGATNLPELPAGFEKRFSRDEGCPQASDFGDVTGLLAIFEKNRDALIAAVQNASQEQLDAPTKRVMPMFKNASELASFMSLHSAMHVGQITIIRRSLGRPPLI